MVTHGPRDLFSAAQSIRAGAGKAIGGCSGLLQKTRQKKIQAGSQI